MENSLMHDRFFCSAVNRPKFCKYDTNKCCLHCEHVQECTALSKQYNTRNAIKSTLPCTSKIVGSNDLCEFAI